MNEKLGESNVIYPEISKTPYWSNYSNAFQNYSMRDIRMNPNILKLDSKLLLRFVKNSAETILDKKGKHDF
jgi:hypothetical protein